MALVDAIIPEPLGGAQRDPQATIEAVGEAVAEALGSLASLDGATLKSRRREKYLEMGRERPL
jgi:acetyl-CoA carboxylase carboxyl transferase subunit alpha